MPDALALRVRPVAAILGMAVLTYATKTAGLWVAGRLDQSARVEAGIDALPGAVVVAFVAPALARGEPTEWFAAALTLAVARKTGRLLAALAVGVGTVAALRAVV